MSSAPEIRHARPWRAPDRQRGATLLITLVMLLFMFMLGEGAARLAMLDQHAGRYWRDQMASRMAAQAALEAALNRQRASTAPDASSPQFQLSATGVAPGGARTTLQAEFARRRIDGQDRFLLRGWREIAPVP